MAVLNTTNMTLPDLAKMMEPDGTIGTVVELLAENNEILLDATFVQGNLTTGHRTIIRNGIPEVTARRLNQGTTPKRSTTAQVTFNCATLAEYSEVDKKLVELSGNPMQARLTQDKGIIEAINQWHARTMFYGNESADETEFTGLANFYNDLSAESGDNVIDAQGTTGDLGSIFLVGWADDKTTGIVPKNSVAGLQVTDLGIQTSENTAGVAGSLMQTYRTYFELDTGLAVQDWRYNVRIANINRTATLADASSGPNLPDLMYEALEKMHSMSGVRPVFYMDRYFRTRLRQQLAAATSNSTLVWENVGGVRTQFFNEVPIRRVDELAVEETRVT